jgi:hypothetical protein
MLSGKYKRHNIIDLKNNYPEKFGQFIMALKNLEESDDWYRICGIHGDTFKPNDKKVLCPTDPEIVTAIGKTGEPFYCKHSVYSFIAWHTPYIYQFELLLNKYNNSSNKNYISLPYLDLTDTTVDFTFINMDKITIKYENKEITIDNPLAGAYYYVDNMKTKTTRNGFLTPKTQEELLQIDVVKKQLNNALYAHTYEHFSSHPVQSKKIGLLTDYIPLETPHNSLHDIIGGTNGNMSDISISAFDPLFWLHHCNMDRHFYTWMYNNTNQFSKSIYPKKITKDSYNATQAPFVPNGIYNTDYNKYKYGWRNQKFKYMLLKDMLKLEKYPFTYDIIEPTPKVDIGSFVELIDILIPRESVKVNVYIIPKIVLKTKKVVKNSDYYAGTGFWFGVNRDKINCTRCNVTRTNMKIDICSYVKKNNITNDNINDYDVKIEAVGLLIKINNINKTYLQEELLKDASYQVVLTTV